jgi:hypothetical protein
MGLQAYMTYIKAGVPAATGAPAFCFCGIYINIEMRG